jgi:hypothetical protein
MYSVTRTRNFIAWLNLHPPQPTIASPIYWPMNYFTHASLLPPIMKWWLKWISLLNLPLSPTLALLVTMIFVVPYTPTHMIFDNYEHIATCNIVIFLLIL